MTTFIDLTCCVSYLGSTSNLALTCKGFYQWLKLNSFPIRTSKGELCLENLAFYKVLDCPFLDDWMSEQVFRSLKVHPDRLQLLLQENVNLETKNDNGETVLILAARRGRTDHLKILLEHKADTKATDKNSNTAMNGQTACLKLLLEHKADIKARGINGNTALIVAANFDETACLKLLLRGGADPNATNIYGSTALLLAFCWGKIDWIKVLLEHGAIAAPGLRKMYPQYAYLWGDSTL